MDFVREQLLLTFSAPLIVACILLEVAITAWYGRKAYTLRQTLENLYFAGLNGTFDILLRGVALGILTLVFQARLFHLEHGWLYWIALLLLQDFAYWALHFVDHHCRFFWAVHCTHHSSDEFNLSTGFRSSVFQPFYRMLYFTPIAWLGFQPLDILFMYAITQIYGSFIHTEQIRRLGWLEHILVTPSHHRVHHASNPKYLDKNMGMVFIFWDKLFGTFAAEDDADPPRYGLTKPLPSRDPVTLVFHEWQAITADLRQRARNWGERFGFIFAPPGWKPRREREGSNQ